MPIPQANGRVAQICLQQLIVCTHSTKITRIAVSESMKPDSSNALLLKNFVETPQYIVISERGTVLFAENQIAMMPVRT